MDKYFDVFMKPPYIGFQSCRLAETGRIEAVERRPFSTLAVSFSLSLSFLPSGAKRERRRTREKGNTLWRHIRPAIGEKAKEREKKGKISADRKGPKHLP